MGETKCDSYCGLYCGACDILIAYKTGNKSKFASFWTKSRLETVQKAQGNTVNKDDLVLKCGGCKSDTVFINCRSCEIRKCASGKNIQYCYECSDYPCNIFTGIKGSEKVLPHLTDKQINMDTIKTSGISKWLSEQENRWKCPGCGNSFSWYSTKCKSCGRDLRKYTFKFTRLNAILLNLGLRSAFHGTKEEKNL